jgi:protein-disulfide isomerase
MATFLRVPVTSHDHFLGPEHAPVTMVEYGDYECPYCGAAHQVIKALLPEFGPTVRYVFRHFPLTEIHPHAAAAAETAEFAGAHNRFWEMHDSLFANQRDLSLPVLLQIAVALGLSDRDLREALATGRYAPKVQSDFLGGVRSGVNGTPTFFINGRRHEGSFAFDDLASAIMAHLQTARTAVG